MDRDEVALKDHGFNPDHILVPTAGGPSSDLSAETARLLRREFGSKISLLHVSDDVRSGEEFLEEWAAAHDLAEADLHVVTGDLETSIARSAEDCSMILIGATGGGLLARLVQGSTVIDIVDEVDCSVVLAERPTRRSLRDRLFGPR